MSAPLTSLLAKMPILARVRGESQARHAMRHLGDVLPYQGLHTVIPQPFGDFQSARSALKGQLVLLGQHMPAPGLTPWELRFPPGPRSFELHAFDWLGDFAALGTKAARQRALGWVLGWVDRFSDGDGPGWTPDISARRMRNLLASLPFLEPALSDEARARITEQLPRQFAYTRQFWQTEISAHRRLRILCALVEVAACLKGWEEARLELTSDLDGACKEILLPAGAIPSRNPEALMHVLKGLIDVRDVLAATDQSCGRKVLEAIAAIAPVLRTLRHGDGSLARFHGGSAGREGQLDRILAEAKTRQRPKHEPYMGFIRLHGGRLTAIMDAARPQGGPDASLAHASTLGFELSSGRRRVLVNVGPGISFGNEWYRTPRTTAAHNTLSIDKTSSSQLASVRGSGPLPQPLQTRPSMVTVSQAEDASGMWVQARHDGYLPDYGLIHERRLFVDSAGKHLHGEDVLLAPDQKSERRFSNKIKGAERLGIAISVHFHLHPEVEVDTSRLPDMVLLRLPSGEIWVFRQKGGRIEVDTSAYLDPRRSEPVPTRHILVRNRTTTHDATLTWSFVRSGDGGKSLRDVRSA